MAEPNTVPRTPSRVSPRRSPLGRRSWRALAAALSLLAAGSARGADLPTPPDGFARQRLADLKAAVLRPSGWSVAPPASAGEAKFMESDPDQRASFSISMIKASGPRRDPVKLADDFLAGMSAALLKEKTWGDWAGPFVMRAGIFRDRGDRPDAHRVYSQVLVNPRTGTMFVVGFEASVRDWDEKWKVGQVVCRFLLLDDDV